MKDIPGSREMGNSFSLRKFVLDLSIEAPLWDYIQESQEIQEGKLPGSLFKGTSDCIVTYICKCLSKYCTPRIILKLRYMDILPLTDHRVE